MADTNMTTGGGEDFTVMTVNASVSVLTLFPHREYNLVSLAMDSSGAPTTAVIYARKGSTAPSADFTSELNKLIILSGASVPIPPKVTTLALIADASTQLQVIALPGEVRY